MNKYDQLTHDMLARVSQHVLDNPIEPPIARATALFTQVNNLKAQFEAHAGSQTFGRGGFRAGATERRLLADDLRTVLHDMAATARGLEPEHPGIGDQFRVADARKSHAKALAVAQAFLTAVAEPGVKQLFTDRAFPADFDVQLTAKIAALAVAVGRKATGLHTQREGTVGLDVLNRQATATMRELRPLMVKHLRESNPLLLEVWKTAARRYAGPTPAAPSTPPTEPDPGSGSGSGSGS